MSFWWFPGQRPRCPQTLDIVKSLKGGEIDSSTKINDNSGVNTLNISQPHSGAAMEILFVLGGLPGCAAWKQHRPQTLKISESKCFPEIGGFQIPEKTSRNPSAMGSSPSSAWGFGSAVTPGVALDKLLRAKFRRRRARADGRPWLEGVAGLAR